MLAVDLSTFANLRLHIPLSVLFQQLPVLKAQCCPDCFLVLAYLLPQFIFPEQILILDDLLKVLLFKAQPSYCL